MTEIQLTKDNFEKEVLQSEIPVLVDFWAEWCGPCKMMLPVVEELARENESFKVGKINVDEQAELQDRFKIMTIPTFIVFKDGKTAGKAIGVQSKDALLEMIGGIS